VFSLQIVLQGRKYIKVEQTTKKQLLRSYVRLRLRKTRDRTGKSVCECEYECEGESEYEGDCECNSKCVNSECESYQQQ